MLTTVPEEFSTLLQAVIVASGETAQVILRDWIKYSVPELETIDVDKFVRAFDDYTDIQLWTLVEQSLARLKQVDYGMKVLSDKRKQGTQLNDNETAELEGLSDDYNDLVLLRAKALLELKQRGYDVNAYNE